MSKQPWFIKHKFSVDLFSYTLIYSAFIYGIFPILKFYYARLGATLPPVTIVAWNISNFMMHHFYLLIIPLAVLVWFEANGRLGVTEGKSTVIKICITFFIAINILSLGLPFFEMTTECFK